MHFANIHEMFFPGCAGKLPEVGEECQEWHQILAVILQEHALRPNRPLTKAHGTHGVEQGFEVIAAVAEPTLSALCFLLPDVQRPAATT